MLNISHLDQNRRGFTLIEFILGMTLIVVLLSTTYTMLDFSRKASALGENEDEILLYGRFVVDYIKEEIRNADLIIPSNKIPNLDSTYPKNIGFVMMKDNGILNSNERYRFYTYYLKEDKLIRISRNLKYNTYPDASLLAGYNEMCDNILSMDNTRNDFSNKLVHFSISMGNDNRVVHSFKSTLYIANNLDY